MLRLLLISFILTLVSNGDAHAQIRYFPDGTDQMKARIAELNPPDKGLPDNEFSLVDERRLVDQEILQLRSIVQQTVDPGKQTDAVDQFKAGTAKTLQDISTVDCTKLPDGRFVFHNAIRSNMNQLRQQVIFRQPNIDLELDPFANAPWQEEARLADADYCGRWKRFVGDSTNQTKLLEYFDKIKTKVVENAKTFSDVKANAGTLLDLLQKRKDAIEKKLAAQSTKTELADKLWIVIGVIGVFSISAILAVKLFSETIQIEWVASGQVIQFVTVMILLSVIMALGLAGILKENTLGTLLGGIGGYVLAQGVGRAAAREVSRGSQPLKS